MSSIYKQQTCSNIEQEIQKSIQPTLNGQKQEPDYIADLVTNLPQNLANVLSNNSNKHYKIAGAFIHQKPIVKFLGSFYASYQKPELGDLLLLYKEKNTNGSEKYNALLLQAKKGSSTGNNPINPQDHQLLLYTKWPVFMYHRGKNNAGINFNGATRSVYPKATHPGAQYLIIDENSKPLSFFCAEPSQNTLATNSLAETIFDFIHFQTGRTFNLIPQKCQNCVCDFINRHFCHKHPDEHCYGWTRVINDLILLLKNAVFNRTKANYRNQDRFSDPHKLFLSSAPFTFNSGNNQNDNDIPNDNEENSKKGIGIIYIESTNEEISTQNI